MNEKQRNQITNLANELGYKFGLNPMPREGLNGSGDFETYDKYMIRYKSKMGEVRGESIVYFDNLDQVIDYLKEKKKGRVKRKKRL